MIYYTHDNGGRPFKVVIDEKDICADVYIYKSINDTDDYYKNPILIISPIHVFIGESPENAMTSYSGCYGDEFKGNSFLFEIDNNNYIFVGCEISSFYTLAPIFMYVSHVGNNDVPYPFAIDELDNIYLITEDVILLKTEERMKPIVIDDPYGYYYTRNRITDIEMSLDPFMDIKEFFINSEEYNLTYNVHPDKNYERFMDDEFGGNVMVEDVNGIIRPVSKELYVEIMNNFAEYMKFLRLDKVIIIKRDY